MNILILSWRGPGHPNAGGAEITTHEHAKGWVRAGHSVTLFTSYFKGAKRQEMLDGVNIIRHGSQVFGVQFRAFLWYLLAPHKEFDLVVDQFHGIPFFTPFYVRTKKLAFIHEVTKEIWKLNPWTKPWYFIPALLGTFIEPLIFKLVYRKIPFMTVSRSTKKDLTEWGIPEKSITVVHNGVNIPRIKIPEKETKKTLIYLGAISKDKGIEDALKVFSKVDKEGNFQFWVVGKSDPSYLIFLKKQSQDLGINKRVKFWGFVDEIKKYQLLAKAHILVNPSIREGWGLVVIEAASMGTPTVAFDVPGLRDSIVDGKTGILDKKHSVESMTKEIINLMNDSNRYQKMRNKSIKWSKRFYWKKSIIESLDLIKKIMIKL